MSELNRRSVLPELAEIDLTFAEISRRQCSGLNRLRAGLARVDDLGSLGLPPLFAACYALWVPGVKVLLELGARTRWRHGMICKATSATFLGALDRSEYLADHPRLKDNAGPDCVRILSLLQAAGAEMPNRQRVPLPYMTMLRDGALVQGHMRLAAALTATMR